MSPEMLTPFLPNQSDLEELENEYDKSLKDLNKLLEKFSENSDRKDYLAIIMLLQKLLIIRNTIDLSLRDIIQKIWQKTNN